MWSRGCWDSRCSADSESETCSSASWMTRAPGTAGRWCFTESPAWARPLSSTSRLSSETTSRSFAPLASRGRRSCPYAALQQLSCPIFDRSAGLPDPQREALSVAFGLTAGPAPNPFLVGLAVLGLLSEAAEDQPLLCVVDDAQWLDRASARALAFVARRLLAERIALLFATRERGEALRGFPEIHIGPLGRRDARALLESVLPARVDDRVLERIVAETHGNPLALLELPRGMTPSQLAGGFGLPAAVPLSARIEEHFTRRVASSRPMLVACCCSRRRTRRAISRSCRAAAERLGDPRVDRASARSRTACCDLRAGVVFRHPLARSAVYRAATVEERSLVHRALADATDPETDPDRRAWHRAQATSMPDEDVAAELERSAARAQARGGFAAAAAFLERSSVLTLDPARRAGRELAAAQAKYEAGAFDEAVTLAANADGRPVGRRPASASWICFAPASRSRRNVGTRRRGCCSPPPRTSSRSTLDGLERSISRRSPPPCSPVAWRMGVVLARSRPRRGPCPSPRRRPRRRTCCSTDWLG